jgi:azurin/glucose/arabinose dehydrogenase
MKFSPLLAFLYPALTAAALHAAAPVKLELHKGDHIAIIGNGLADRMQHDGTIEAFIHKAFPQDDISIRNLGFAADEVNSHVRSDDVPTPDEWLTRVKADVVLAFWGFNESFKGYEGVEKFKSELDKYVKDLKAAKYNGTSAPRIVLFSPIAEEKVADPNFPDATTNNTNLQNYTAAMAEVAKANDVQFVDLYIPSLQLYRAAKTPLTHNGIHLTMAGYQALAPVIYTALFGVQPPPVDASLEKIRQAVKVTNDMWLSRYRTVDQYNIFGGRSILPYASNTDGLKHDNRYVLFPEMAVRDVMTDNREKRVWALAKGGDLKIDDSNVPEVPKIGTNKPGTNPDGSYTYLGGEEAIKHMTLPKGVKVELVASEEQFPELVSPVQMAWDAKGRLWISSWKNYPERTPSSTDGDKLLIFDIGADGKAKKCTTFLGNLNCPTGFQFYKDGVFVMESPDLWYVRNVNDQGMLQERVLDGLDAADSHHETNAMAIEPGGGMLLSDGVFFRTQVETAAGPVRNVNGAIYRWEPRTGKFERYVAYGFANPHGKVFDYWGNDIITDATGNNSYFGPAFSGHIDFPGTHPHMEQFWERPSRPCPGTAILSSRAWPAEYQNNFLNCNVISIQGIFRVKVTEDGSGLKGETLENLVTSDDPNFRPSGISVAPDGSLYFMDWHKPLIGHLQHHLRDPNREMAHGRIYRLTFEGMPLLTAPKIAGEPVEKLLDLLKEPENNTRERAKIELGGRDTAQVMAAVDNWVAGLDKKEPTYEHNLLEALWVKQYHNVVDEALLKRVLQSPDYHARTQGVRVLCYWRDRIKDPLPLLKIAANDESPRVRLEAVRAASFFNGNDTRPAIEVTYEALKHDQDYYLDYTTKETIRQLEPEAKNLVIPADPKVADALISKLSNSEVSQAPDVEPILHARIERKGIDPNTRSKALERLAKLHNTDVVAEIVSALDKLDAAGGASADDLGKLLVAGNAAEITKARPSLIALGEKARQESVKRAVFAALVTADGKPDNAWADTAKSEKARQSLVESTATLVDPSLRAKFQPLLASVLADAKTSSGVRDAALRALPLMGPDNAKANFATLASYVTKGIDQTSAARAIAQLPRESWDAATAAQVIDSILTYAKSVPPKDRTEQRYVETVQTGMELASLLAPPEAARIRKELRSLGVSVFVVKTVREQMRYDTPRIVVEAGKPFEVIFENVDMMPHNFVLVQPGTRQAVAEAVQTMKPDHLDKEGRAYIPWDGKKLDKRVLDATRLIEPGHKETLKLTAPKTEGEYEYVCTFPGHWMIMTGKLIVTKDVDAYLQKNPEAPAPAVPGAPPPAVAPPAAPKPPGSASATHPAPGQQLAAK